MAGIEKGGGDPTRAFIAGMGLEALSNGKSRLAAEAALELAEAEPDAVRILMVNLALDLGKIGEDALAEIQAETEQRKSKTG